ncbi:serine/threonine protein kinase [Richelia intracellularis]|nr:serine/threonine protein kinase [Richelia intracellularis]
MTCHLLFLYHTPYYQKSRTPINWGEDNRVHLVYFGAVQDKAVKEGVTFTVVGTYGYAFIE